MSGRPLWAFKTASRRRAVFNAHKGLPRIFYLTYQSSRLVLSYCDNIFEIKVDLAEKFQVLLHPNMEEIFMKFKDALHGYDFFC